MMISALLENVDDDPSLEIYVDLTAFPNRHIAPYSLVPIVYDFLLGSEKESTPINLSDFGLETSLLSLLGAQHEQADGGLAVALPSKGQVTYLSILETHSLHPHNMHRRVVLPGWFQYEDRRYSYMTGGEMNQFDLQMSMVQIGDYSEEPFPDVNSSENFSWILSVDDDYLQLYLAPHLKMNASLDVRSCMHAISSLRFYRNCSPTCGSLSDFLPELRYCRTVGAALSANHSYVFRVLSCSKNRIDFFYAQAAVGERVEATKQGTGTSFLGIVYQNICLGCACERITDEIEDRIQTSIVVCII
jgi:hypothetical protein